MKIFDIYKNYIQGHVRAIILLSWIYLFFFDYVTEEKKIMFFSIICIIYLYIRIYKMLDNFIKNRMVYISLFKKIEIHLFFLNLLMFVYTIRNPFLYFLYYIDILNVRFSKFINYKFKNWTKLRFWSILLITSIFINSLKMLLEYYYNFIEKWKEKRVFELLFMRLETLVLSIFIFTDFFITILNLVGGYMYLIIYIYIVLILLSSFFQYYNIKIFRFNTYQILVKRYHATMLGFFLLNYMKKIKEDLPGDFKFSSKYKYCIIYSYLIPESIEVEWDLEQLRIASDVYKLYNEIKKYPTTYLYDLLCFSLMRPGINFGKWIIYMQLDLYTEREKKFLNFLYEHDKLALKLILFLIWEMENDINIIDKNNINIAECNSNYIIENDIFKYNLNATENVHLKNKKKNKFFDLDENNLFWTEWYEICYTKLDSVKSITYDLSYVKQQQEIQNVVLSNYFDINWPAISQNKNDLETFVELLHKEWLIFKDIKMDEKDFKLKQMLKNIYNLYYDFIKND